MVSGLVRRVGGYKQHDGACNGGHNDAARLLLWHHIWRALFSPPRNQPRHGALPNTHYRAWHLAKAWRASAALKTVSCIT